LKGPYASELQKYAACAEKDKAHRGVLHWGMGTVTSSSISVAMRARAENLMSTLNMYACWSYPSPKKGRVIMVARVNVIQPRECMKR
jgi:hypothetical protein